MTEAAAPLVSALTVAARLVLILSGLREAVLEPGPGRLGATRLGTLFFLGMMTGAERIARLATRLQAGCPTRPRSRMSGSVRERAHRIRAAGAVRGCAAGAVRGCAAGDDGPRVLPRRFGWLVKMVPAAAPYAARLRVFLSEPETVALFAAAPRMRVVLRPICRMLGVAMDLPGTAGSFPPGSAGVGAGMSPAASGGGLGFGGAATEAAVSPRSSGQAAQAPARPGPAAGGLPPPLSAVDPGETASPAAPPPKLAPPAGGVSDAPLLAGRFMPIRWPRFLIVAQVEDWLSEVARLRAMGFA